MEELTRLIGQVTLGDSDAYEPIVRRFQDMAVGYGYTRLGDWQLAEDAAQEAFIAAYLALPDLHDPRAFPGWFRQIVIKHIDRIRRKRRREVTLDHDASIADGQPTLAEVVEQQEVQHALMTAIHALPCPQREVVTLFYLGASSQRDISCFLDIPVSTVKMRLYHARKALQQHLLTLVAEELPAQRPSRNPRFMEKLMSYAVTTKAVPAQTIVSLTRDCFISDLQAHLDGGIKTLMVYAQTRGVSVAGYPFAMYHGAVRDDQHAPVEICVPISGTIPPTIEIAVKELPATTVAATAATVRQSIYPGVLKAYEAIEAWIKGHGHTIADRPREIYLSFNTSILSPTASLDDPCVEIAWPYQ